MEHKLNDKLNPKRFLKRKYMKIGKKTDILDQQKIKDKKHIA